MYVVSCVLCVSNWLLWSHHFQRLLNMWLCAWCVCVLCVWYVLCVHVLCHSIPTNCWNQLIFAPLMCLIVFVVTPSEIIFNVTVCVCVSCLCDCVCVCVSIICSCFLYFGLHTSGCPTLVRSDCGTENVSIATCQMAARHEHDDQFAGGNSFIFGSSIRNTVSMMCIVTSILSHGSSCSELRAGGLP